MQTFSHVALSYSVTTWQAWTGLHRRDLKSYPISKAVIVQLCSCRRVSRVTRAQSIPSKRLSDRTACFSRTCSKRGCHQTVQMCTALEGTYCNHQHGFIFTTTTLQHGKLKPQHMRALRRLYAVCCVRHCAFSSSSFFRSAPPRAHIASVHLRTLSVLHALGPSSQPLKPTMSASGTLPVSMSSLREWWLW